MTRYHLVSSTLGDRVSYMISVLERILMAANKIVISQHNLSERDVLSNDKVSHQFKRYYDSTIGQFLEKRGKNILLLDPAIQEEHL